MELCIIYNIIDILDLTMPIQNLLFTYYNDFCFLNNKKSWILQLFFICFYISYTYCTTNSSTYFLFLVWIKNGIILWKQILSITIVWIEQVCIGVKK